MTPLSPFSATRGGPPEPVPKAADERLLALGWAAWEAALTEAGDEETAAAARAWSNTTDGQCLLAALFGNSPFLTGLAVAQWDLLVQAVTEGFDRRFEAAVAAVESREEPGENRAALMRRLRLAKRRVALLAAVAELSGAWPIERQMSALSRFADAAIGAALRHLLRAAAHEPSLDDPEHGSGLIVLAMGKLGAAELNYSSDIDLILLYDPAANPDAAGDDAQSRYVRLARELVRILDERTGDGYVFRTDLRLRPDPRSTPLAISVPAALTYYETVGQNWERAAMIKARPAAGDRDAGQRFLAELRPFIWRRHLDFAAIADIHSIKRQIQAHRGGARIAIEGHDIKTGRGGIREIEFFAQTQQLIWGGRLPLLRVTQTVSALRRLAAAKRIDPQTAETLIADYRFLRRVEHRLQMVDDAQTHRLPDTHEGTTRLAIFLGYPDADAFVAELSSRLRSVERHYAELFEEAPSLSASGNLVFTGAEDDEATLATIAQLGFADPPQVAAMVRGWHHGRIRATRSQRAREILTEFVPELLRVFGAAAHSDLALLRFDQFLMRLPAGVQLFSLFHANPGLLGFVADIMAEAPLLAERLALRPALLESVLTDGFAAPIAGLAELAADLAALLDGARAFEDTLDLLRRWADERRFHVGIQLLRGELDGSRAGAALADIAETALAALLPAVAADFARSYGEIAGGSFAVIGMGRLGSRDMTLASDLDLILIYDAQEDSPGSNGPRALSVSTYYARLSQRLISAITSPTAEGRLYEVDMRLRPSGASGPIALSLAAFSRYQRQSAWTWEHMALTRARPVAGDLALCQRVSAAITAALTVPRDARQLLMDVADMRERIADNHPRPDAWDLRNRGGGLVDLEFTVQYLILRAAARHSAALCPDPYAALMALGTAGALPAKAAQDLGESLILLRTLRAVLALLSAGTGYATEPDGPAGATLARCAGAIDFARLEADMTAACAKVRTWYDRLIARPAQRLARAKNQQISAETAG